ncbi:MAG TPA: thioesterase domain-containing protein [Candidatus Limnocylindrales bacterium]|nr:thioesterase domain-containing protein [Candidatus Limnocylindrales bacterium]
MARAWAEALDRPWVGVRDSFASLGGDQGAYRRMLDRVACHTGVDEALVLGSSTPTVEGIAAALKLRSEMLRQRGRGFWARNVEGAPGVGRPPLFFLHGERSGGLHWLTTLGRLGSDQPVFGIAPHVTAGQPVPPTVEAIAASHLEVIREMEPDGPYLLGGHCNGSVVAFEAAHQLLAAGQRVVGILLVAPMLPRTYRRGAMGLAVQHVMPHVDLARWIGFRIRRRARRALGVGPPPRPAPLDDWTGEVFELYSAILAAYRPPRLSVPSVIVWPALERRRFRAPSDWAWRRALPGASRAEIPGTHMGCCAPEHSARTAERLRAAINSLLAQGLFADCEVRGDR